MKYTIKKAVAGLVFLLPFAVNAAIVSGDFRTEADLPYCCDDAGALVHENLGATVGAGAELTGANFVANPSGWMGGVVHMDLDPTTNILTLASQDDLDFQTFDAWISNITFDAGEIITGFSLISGNLTSLGLTEILEFTSNSIHIAYDFVSDFEAFDFNESQAQFQIITSADSNSVPAPASIALLGLGLVGMALTRKKKAS